MVGIISWARSPQRNNVKRRSYPALGSWSLRLIVQQLLERSPECFQFPSLRLTLQPPLFRTLRRLRGSALLARDCYALNEFAQSSERILSILLLAPILLGLDRNHTLL